MKHCLPVLYAESDGELIVVAGYHQHKKWWRNLRVQSGINVCYRGKWFEASAKAFEGDVAVNVPLLRDYLKRFPESARIRGLTLDAGGNVVDAERLQEEAKKVVMVNIRMQTSTVQTSSRRTRKLICSLPLLAEIEFTPQDSLALLSLSSYLEGHAVLWVRALGHGNVFVL